MFTLPQRREIKKLAVSRLQDHDLPFSTWLLSKTWKVSNDRDFEAPRACS